MTKISKSKTTVLAATATALAALILVLSTSTQKIQADNPQQGNPFTLAGTWEEIVGEAPGPTFRTIETFTESGGSIEINNGPAGPTTGIGTWIRIGPRDFLAKHLKQKFDGNGNLEMTIKVRRSITLNSSGSEFSGRDNVELFDPLGNKIPVSIPSAAFHGKRMTVEPLSW